MMSEIFTRSTLFFKWNKAWQLEIAHVITQRRTANYVEFNSSFYLSTAGPISLYSLVAAVNRFALSGGHTILYREAVPDGWDSAAVMPPLPIYNPPLVCFKNFFFPSIRPFCSYCLFSLPSVRSLFSRCVIPTP